MSRSRNLTVLAIILFALVACAAPTQAPSGFLADYSKLRPAPDIPGAMLHVEDGADLAGYDKVLLEPIQVVFRSGARYAGASPYALKEVTDYFHNSIVRALGDAYPVAEEPGPGVLQVRAAITGIQPVVEAPPLRGSPATYAQAKLREAAASHFAVIETALEAELLDAESGERLASFLDQRRGSEGSLGWDQVAGALDFWADQLRRALDESRN